MRQGCWPETSGGWTTFNVQKETILGIKQIGEKIAASVSTFFHDRKNLQLFESMKKLGLDLSNPDFASDKKDGLPLEGLTLVITGTLPIPRKDAEALIEAHGGHAASTVSASTDFLVVGDDAGSKLEKANKLGVKVISFDALIKMTVTGKTQQRLF